MGAPARIGREACTAGLETAGSILKRTHPELIVSKYRLRQADGISLVRKNREAGTQRLAFSSAKAAFARGTLASASLPRSLRVYKFISPSVLIRLGFAQ